MLKVIGLQMLMKKRLSYIAIALSVVLASVAIYFTYKYIANLPKTVVQYQKVKLGMDMDEVMYNLGYPPDLLWEDSNPPSFAKGRFLALASKAEVEKSKNGAKDFFYWQYPSKDKDDTKRVDIEFDKATKKVTEIGCYVSPKAWVTVNTCAVNGIQSLDSEEVVLDKLGAPDEEKIDGTVKTMLYKKLNMKVLLAERTVYYIIVKKID